MAEVLEQRLVAASADELVRLLEHPEDWLHDAASRAGRAGQAADAELRAEMGLDPLRVHLAKRVHLETGRAQRTRGKIVVPLTWEATGFAGLFPVMDAVLELHPAGRGRTRIAFWGRYDPPLGRVGDVIDRLIAHRVAQRSVVDLLDAVEDEALRLAPTRPA